EKARATAGWRSKKSWSVMGILLSAKGHGPGVLIGGAGLQAGDVLLFREFGGLILPVGQGAPGLQAEEGRVGSGGLPDAEIAHLPVGDRNLPPVAGGQQRGFSAGPLQDDGVAVEKVPAQPQLIVLQRAIQRLAGHKPGAGDGPLPEPGSGGELDTVVL